MSGCVCGYGSANDLDDAYQKLKDAQTAKDADAVKKWATETAKLAKAEATGPKLEGLLGRGLAETGGVRQGRRHA